jgi:hypothetical protein
MRFLMPSDMDCHLGKKNAARPIIPGKNPKTQRDVQSSRLVLRHENEITGQSSGQRILCKKRDFY